MAAHTTLRQSRRLRNLEPENAGFVMDKKQKLTGQIELPAPKRRRVPKVRKYTFVHRRTFRRSSVEEGKVSSTNFVTLAKNIRSARKISNDAYFAFAGFRADPISTNDSSWWEEPEDEISMQLINVEDVDTFVPEQLLEGSGSGNEALASLRMRSASTPLQRDGVQDFDTFNDGMCVINSLLKLCDAGRLSFKFTKENLIREFNESALGVPYAQGGFLGSPEHGELSVEKCGISSYVLVKWAQRYDQMKLLAFTPDLSTCILHKERSGSKKGGTSLAFAVDGTSQSPHIMIADNVHTLACAKHFAEGDARSDGSDSTKKIRDEAFEFRQSKHSDVNVLPCIVNFDVLEDGTVLCDGEAVDWGEFLSRAGTVLTPALNLAPLLPSMWGQTGRLAGTSKQKWVNGARLTQFSEKDGVTVKSYSPCTQLLEFAPLVGDLATLDFNKCTLAQVARAYVQHTFPTHLPMARHAPETVRLLQEEKVSGHRVIYFNPFETECRAPRVGLIDIRRAYATACLTMQHGIPIPGEDDSILPWSEYPFGGELRDLSGSCIYWVQQKVIRPPLMGRYCKTNAATLRYIIEDQGRGHEVRVLFFQRCSHVVEGDKLREVVSGMLEFSQPTSSLAQKLLVNEWCGSNGRFNNKEDGYRHQYSEDVTVALSLAVGKGARAAVTHTFTDQDGAQRTMFDVCSEVPVRATVARDSMLPYYEAIIWASWVELAKLVAQIEVLCETHDSSQYAIDNWLEGPLVYKSPTVFMLSTDCVGFIQPPGQTITSRDLVPSEGWEYRDEPQSKVDKLRNANLQSTMSFAKCVRDNPRRMFTSDADLAAYKASFSGEGEFPEPLFVYRPNEWAVTECAPTADEIASGEMGDFTQRTVATVLEKVQDGGVFLTGVGGAGKSFISAQVVKRLTADGRKVAVCTPIHKGCDVLAKAFDDAGCEDAPVPETLHKLLRYHEGAQDDADNEEKGTASVSKLDCDVLLIDEISMIPRHMWGMLRLLFEANPGVKLLLVGDLSQHEPVVGDIDYDMRLLKHFVNFQQVLLAYNHRCKESPNLHETMSHLREAIEGGVDVSPNVAWIPRAEELGDADLHIVHSNHTRCHVNHQLMQEAKDNEGCSVFLPRDPSNVWGQDMYLYTDLPLLVRTSADLPTEGIKLYNGFSMKVVGLDTENELCLVRHEGGRIGRCDKKEVGAKHIAKLLKEVEMCRKRLDKVLEQQSKRAKASTRHKFQPEVDRREEALRVAELAARASATSSVGEEEEPGYLTLTFQSIARTCVPGYALTSYNAQGSTFDCDIQLHELDRMSARASYVALSRCKDEEQLSIGQPVRCSDHTCSFRPADVTLYSITNEDKGLLYVGHVLGRDVQDRWDEHKVCTTSEVGKALQEHGPDSFNFEVLKAMKVNSRVVAKHHEMRFLEKLIAAHPGWTALNQREEATFDEEMAFEDQHR